MSDNNAPRDDLLRVLSCPAIMADLSEASYVQDMMAEDVDEGTDPALTEPLPHGVEMFKVHGTLFFGAASGAVVRVTEDGPLFLDLARQDGGRWVIPGAVRVFTSRAAHIHLSMRTGEVSLVVDILNRPWDASPVVGA